MDEVEINGVKVFFDGKKIERIVNAVVFFLDGSQTDVTTKKIENKGKGYISFKKDMISKTSNKNSSIRITQTGDGSQQEVVISGVKKIKITQTSGK